MRTAGLRLDGKPFHVEDSSVQNGSLSQTQVALALEEYLALAEVGSPPAREDFLAQYPQFSEKLALCLESLDLLQYAVEGFADPGAAERGLQGFCLGDFRLLAELGRGGMGIVYEAEQLSLSRRVALKVLPFAALLDKTQLERFKNEARAIALLKHPNLVGIHAVGVERGVHYYAMDLIKGRTLAELIGATFSAVSNPSSETKPVATLPTQRSAERSGFLQSALSLAVQAAETLDYAHREGIIHRDVKPSNLIVDEEGRLFVTDFGLARIQSATELTVSGDVVGTYRYMSPEQIQGQVVDHRTDIYSLGATLYELLSGRPAVTGGNRAELVRKVCEENPRSLRQWDPGIPNDLETIVQKCLCKSPHDRYQSMGELGADLSRLQQGRPILARPSSYWNRLGQCVQRNRKLVAASMITLVALLTLSIGGPLIAWRLNSALKREGSLHRELASQLYDSQVRDAHAAIESGDYLRANELLAEQPAALRDVEWYYLSGLVEEDALRTIARHPVDLMRVAASADDQHIACGNWWGEIAIYNRNTSRPVHQFRLREDQAITLALQFSPDGRLLFAGGETTACLIDVAGRSEVARWQSARGIITAAAFSPKGKWLAIGYGDSVRQLEVPTDVAADVDIYDVDQLRRADTGKPAITLQWPRGRVSDVAFSCDEQYFAAGDMGGMVRIWRLPAFVVAEPLGLRGSAIDRIAFHPQQSKILAVSSGISQSQHPRSTVALYDLGSRALVRTVAAPFSRTADLAFSPDGRQFATGHGNGDVCIWWSPVLLGDESSADALVSRRRIHGGKVYDLAFSPGGDWLYSVGVDGCFKRLAMSGNPPNSLEGHGFTGRLAFFRDGTRLASGGYFPSDLKLWDYSTGALLKNKGTDAIYVTDMAILPTQQHVAYVGYTWRSPNGDGDTKSELGIWDIVTNQCQVLFRGSGETAHVSVSARGTFLAASLGNQLRIYDAATRRLLAAPRFEERICHAWHPFQDLAAVGLSARDGLGRVAIWSLADEDTAYQLECGNLKPISMSFAPDGRRLAVGTAEGPILVWQDFERAGSKQELRGHNAYVWDVSFSPSANRVASAGLDATVRVWNTTTGNELLLFQTVTDWNYTAKFSHDGRTFAYGGGKGGGAGNIHLIRTRR